MTCGTTGPWLLPVSGPGEALEPWRREEGEAGAFTPGSCSRPPQGCGPTCLGHSVAQTPPDPPGPKEQKCHFCPPQEDRLRGACALPLHLPFLPTWSPAPGPSFLTFPHFNTGQGTPGLIRRLRCRGRKGGFVRGDLLGRLRCPMRQAPPRSRSWRGPVTVRPGGGGGGGELRLPLPLPPHSLLTPPS